MRKILVMGAPGAGKSTFARRLSANTGLPLIHLDQQFWNAGWVPTAPAAFRAKVEALIAGPAWIMDGDYGGTLDIRIAAADFIVYLDQPRWLCMVRVLLRSITTFGRVRADLAPGCPEQFSWDFYKYVWNYFGTKGPERLAKLAAFKDKVVILNGSREAEDFLQLHTPRI
ncbi:MAG: hypothetical protein AB7E79_16375 [Rhodospirillaceae bacterium]